MLTKIYSGQSKQILFLNKIKFSNKHKLKTYKERLQDAANNIHKENAYYEEDLKFIEDKTAPLLNQITKFRLPVYLTIPPLIWLSPFSQLYSITILFANYSLVFMTALEGTVLFSMGINRYAMNSPNAQANPFSNNSKRMLMIVIFSLFLILSGFSASHFDNGISLAELFILNVYLLIKTSYHVTYFGLNKILMEKRLKNMAMNLLLISFVFVVNNRKKNLRTNNVLL